MNRSVRGFVAVGLGVLVTGLVPAPLMASENTQWCRIDDPASWRAGAADGSPVCPTPEIAERLPETLYAPLPCGRYAALRRIVVPAETVLDHMDVTIGAISDRDSPVDALINRPRTVPLVGSYSLSDRQNGEDLDEDALLSLQGRAFYIGKYETLEHHFDLLKRGLLDVGTPDRQDAEVCADYTASIARLNERKADPATGLSWFDAVEFTRAWSAWLMARDRERIARGEVPSLPWEQGSPGYLRLPTEAEWEFAARGGLARPEDQSTMVHLVADGDAGGRRPSLEEIAVISDIGGGRRSPIKEVGTKAPNLFGLYDTVGNADEIVFEMFRLTRPDTLHGQFGGYIVKGGHAMTPTRVLGVGHRREVPFFRLDGESRSSLTGFRPVLSGPVIVGGTNPDRPWSQGLQNPHLMGALERATGSLGVANDQARGEAAQRLERLRDEARSGKVRADTLSQEIARIQDDLERSNTLLNGRDRDVRRSRLRSMALVGFSIGSMGANILSAEQQLAGIEDVITPRQRTEFAPQIEQLERSVGAYKTSLEAAFGFYVSTAISLSDEAPEAVTAATDFLQNEMELAGISVLKSYLDGARGHVGQVRRSGGTVSSDTKENWLEHLDHTRAARRARFNY